MTEFFLLLIGINIGAAIGWYVCKKFNGNMDLLMDWFNERR